MKHLEPFRSRKSRALQTQSQNGWTLKQYAIFADGRYFDESVTSAAFEGAIGYLPKAGTLQDPNSNHGVGFQIVHFAEVAIVSPNFYWMWGSVLAHATQLRAPWSNPTSFEKGFVEIIGCVWELEIITFEVRAWQNSMLTTSNQPEQGIQRYLSSCFEGS